MSTIPAKNTEEIMTADGAECSTEREHPSVEDMPVSGSTNSSHRRFLSDIVTKTLAHIPKKYVECRTECQRCLELLAAKTRDIRAENAVVQADEFFSIWKRGIADAVGDGNQVKMIQTLLSGLHKMAEAGLVRGAGQDYSQEAEAPRLLIETILDTVTHATKFPEETVQMQAVLVLAALVAHPQSVVHLSATLVMAVVRTGFQVHQDARQVVVLKSVHSALLQVVTVIGDRMEAECEALIRGDPELQARRVMNNDKRPHLQSGNSTEHELQQAETRNKGVQKEVRVDSGPKETREEALRVWLSSFVTTSLIDKTAMAESRMFEILDETTGGVAGKYGWCIICREPAPHYCLQTGDPVCSKECKQKNLARADEIHKLFPPPSPGGGPRLASLPTDQRPVYEECQRRTLEEGEEEEYTGLIVQHSRRIEELSYYRCTSAVFEELCKMSGRGPTSAGVVPTTESPTALAGTIAPPSGNATTTPLNSALHAKMSSNRAPTATGVVEKAGAASVKTEESPEAKSESRSGINATAHGVADQKFVKQRRLTLELVSQMLNNGGHCFRNTEKFIHSLKTCLCLALIKNCVSAVPRIFSLSFSICVALIANFQKYLKAEVGIFMESIFLRILESPNSTFQHKQRVLTVFYKLCTDAKTSTELFLNYDCDVLAQNLFERVVDGLGKIAQGKFAAVDYSVLITVPQEQELRVLALESLVGLMASMVARAKIEDEEGTTSSSPDEDESGASSGRRNGEQTVCGMEPHSDHGATQSIVMQDIEVHGAASSDQKVATKIHVRTGAGQLEKAGRSRSFDVVGQKARKGQLRDAIQKFNAKPRKGVELFYNLGFVSQSPEYEAHALVEFLRRTNGIDKTAIGDFLGEPAAFNQECLSAMVNKNSFSNIQLDSALRLFLADFRLPGEAQKIDRMMEKFADKYCADNPANTEFGANADCAYVLAFSLVMLQTDLHNGNIKNKMTAQDFINNNRGINAGESLSKEYLSSLYRSIAENPITLDDDDDKRARIDSQNATSQMAKVELFSKEVGLVVERSQRAIEQLESDRVEEDNRTADMSVLKRTGSAVVEHTTANGPETESARSAETVFLVGGTDASEVEEVSTTPIGTSSRGPREPSRLSSSPGKRLFVSEKEVPFGVAGKALFEVICWPLLATLSVLLEATSWVEPSQESSKGPKQPLENRVLQLCVEGFRHCVRFSARLRLETERDAFVCSLAKFTYLATIKGIQQKNIECIKAMLEIGLSEGDFLSFSWRHVLHCVSHLDRLQIIRTQRPDAHSFEQEGDPGQTVSATTDGPLRRSADLSAATSDTSRTSSSRTATASHQNKTARRKIGTGVTGLVRLSEEDRSVEALNSEAILSQLNTSNAIENLFERSVALNARGIVDFVSALCEVSADEMNLHQNDEDTIDIRTFSLQKLVEVADANMYSRIRLVWRRIWLVLSQHFGEVCSRITNPSVCLFALDSLRQLISKFLDRDELSNFEFQSEMLRPLELVLMNPSTSMNAKHFAITTVRALMETRSGNIKSGWRSILQILQAATRTGAMRISSNAGEYQQQQQQHTQQRSLSPAGSATSTNPSVVGGVASLSERRAFVQKAFAVMQHIAEKHQEHFFANFSEGMQAVVAFAQCLVLPTIEATEAVQLIFLFARVLAAQEKARINILDTNVKTRRSTSSERREIDETESNKVRSNQPGSRHHSGDDAADRENGERSAIGAATSATTSMSPASSRNLSPSARTYWLPLLHGLSTLSADSRREVRSRALSGLFEVLKEHGGECFDADTWQATFRAVLFPLFDDIQLEQTTGTEFAMKKQDAWCLAALSNCVVLIEAHFEALAFVFEDFLSVLVGMATHSSEYIARLGVEALKQLIGKTGHKLSGNHWAVVAKGVQALFHKTMPVAIQDDLYSALMAEKVKDKGNSIDRTAAAGNNSNVGHEGARTALPTTGIGIGTAASAALTAHPQQLHQPGDVGGVDEVTKAVVTGCVVQLLLIDCVHSIFQGHGTRLPREVVITLLAALEASFSFAHEFNQKISLRMELKRLGFMRDMRDLPGLLKQEREGLTCYLGILFALSQMDRLDAELCDKLISCARSVIHNYVRKERQMHNMIRDGDDEVYAVEIERETTGLQPIITQVILQNLLHAGEKLYSKSKEETSGELDRKGPASDNGESSVLSVKDIADADGIGIREPGPGANSKDELRSEMGSNLFKAVCPTLFPLLADLCLSSSHELRAVVREVLLQNVAPLLQL
ncbi:unnamed protein product [Amoebophrya sp. A120]|nr:unnamed protein product [Amoebophrya sp. A120]|eukprot:GSA120T00015300001.1